MCKEPKEAPWGEDIMIPGDVYTKEMCPFFFLFPSSPDPHETLYGVKFCVITGGEKAPNTCNANPLECPLRNSTSNLFGRLVNRLSATTAQLEILQATCNVDQTIELNKELLRQING